MNPGTLSLLMPFGFGPLAVTNGYGGKATEDAGLAPSTSVAAQAVARSPQVRAGRRRAPGMSGTWQRNGRGRG